MTGRVVKGIGGFYYVSDDKQIHMGNARGVLKRKKNLIYVGDIVDFEMREDGDCIITKVHKRKNYLIRPPVSNLDKLVVVFAAADPEVNYLSVDKLCASSENINVSVIICITKKDLVDEARLNELKSVYQDVFPTFAVDSVTGEGVDELLEAIRGSAVALAGPSGVGKSTLLNAITKDASSAETGELSEKTGRGKHTTRHVEIFDLGDGTFVYDTPGFTSLELRVEDPNSVRDLFVEFLEHKQYCKYRDCIHINEPECSVKEALEEGKIQKTRYESYLSIYEEVKKCQK